MADGLITQNAKTVKTDPNAKVGDTVLHRGAKGGIIMSGLALLPHQSYWGVPDDVERPDKRKPNVCAGSSIQCRMGCLEGTGQNATKGAHEAKYRRMDALYKYPHEFVRMCIAGFENRMCESRASGYFPFFRFNYLSDIPWEYMIPGLFHSDMFRNVQFYDYTKVRGRIPNGPDEGHARTLYEKHTGFPVPENYDITFSYNGDNAPVCGKELERGKRVAIVFLSNGQKNRGMHLLPEMPTRWWGHDVVNGDHSDARPCDPPNARSRKPVIVGLRYKLAAGYGMHNVDKLHGFVVVLSAEMIESEGERALVIASTPVQENYDPEVEA
jgi:hypothetical protein